MRSSAGTTANDQTQPSDVAVDPLLDYAWRGSLVKTAPMATKQQPCGSGQAALTLEFGAIARKVLAHAVGADRDPVPRHAFGHRLPAQRFRDSSSPGVADAWNGLFPPPLSFTAPER